MFHKAIRHGISQHYSKHMNTQTQMHVAVLEITYNSQEVAA